MAAPAELAERLESLAPGSVRDRAIDRLAMAHDASHYLMTPLSVVTVRDTAHLAQLLGVASGSGARVAFRSGGTSLSGQASTTGLLLDTRANFRAIEVLDGGERVRVQPGATVRQVNARLARHGRKLGPDPASEAACTIGGVVANNSSGMACGTEHNTYNTIVSAVLVLADGTVLDTAAPDADLRLRTASPELWTGLAELREHLRADAGMVATIRRQYAIKNTMGYGLNAFLDHDAPVDILVHLVVGSEGTLAFVAEATFATLPVRTHTATGMLYFRTLADATGALPALVASGLATVELLDATSLRVAQRDPGADDELLGLDVDRHAALLVEYQEPDADALAARLAAWSELAPTLPLAQPAALTRDPARRNALWHIRKDLYATVAGNRPSGTTAMLEDIAVPVATLRATCEGLIELFDRHGYEDSVIFGHAKDGNIHFMLTEHFDDPGSTRRYAEFTEEMVELVLRNGGTLKAEHGTGRIMAPYVRRQFGDALYGVMLRVKQLADPGGLLNPGVLLNEDPDGPLQHLKLTPTVEAEVDRCVECGYCEPVCPSKDLTVTPRQRIVLRRERERARLAGDLALVEELDRDYRYDGLDTCAADGMCQTACPVRIDTGKLVKRLRAEHDDSLVAAGWNVAAGRWDAVTRVGAVAMTTAKLLPAPLVTAVTDLGRIVIGSDDVPRYDRGLPRGGVRRRPREAADAVAVYVPSCIGSLFGPAESSQGVREAFLALCERARVAVAIPEGVESLCCGTPWTSKGNPRGHRTMADTALPVLREATRAGELPVISDGVSCTEGFLHLTDGAGFTVVDAVEFVEREVLPLLTVRRPLESVAVHPTCSSTHLGVTDPMVRVARAISDDVVVPVDWGCCGFAGDRGMLHPELTASATRAEAAELAGREFAAYASANRTCELGMTRATGRPYRHILELLDDATRP
ncbi:FAD-binding and (Fe-S)-binding domain-containing protein [Leifsonia sp. C5G2]|uniref:FAD-binding and (Fe-S)-binding domain-containing protein n=1 Tax=Leifsonia sp. C5G2 TaxID=2735269 RepID=UPI001585456B|nr:FAD-binding and (Fe-S)-binding domain-containing protein [Leifsonia sp. C5G2]NUU05031.1 FAD-binding oxidoreductase [Leifsonia sp. C5G2]